MFSVESLAGFLISIIGAQIWATIQKELQQTKNGERREIPINETLRSVLQGVTRRIDVPYVFHMEVSGKHYQDIKRSFNTALRKAGIKDFHFHDLRHTFASHLVMAGVDITTVSRLLGHKTLTMTLRYSHLAPSHMVKAVNILDSTLTGRPTTQKLHNPKELPRGEPVQIKREGGELQLSYFRDGARKDATTEVSVLQGKSGAENRIRTDDLLITNQLLYQLSYLGTEDIVAENPEYFLTLRIPRAAISGLSGPSELLHFRSGFLPARYCS